MLIVLILFLVWLIIMLFSRLSLLRIQAHWHGKNTVITQFSTPHNLTPAEYGYIFDRKFGRNEMTATIVDLFQRKILGLKPVSKIVRPDIIITAQAKRPKNHMLADCEAVLVAHVTYSQGGQRKLGEMTSVYSRETGTRWQYEQAVINQLIDKGYLTERARSEPFADRIIKSSLSFGITWFIFFTTIGNKLSGSNAFDRLDSFMTILLLLPVFGLVCVALYVYLSVLSHEIRLSAGLPRFATQKLRAEWADVVGFRDYLRVVEWHRLKHMPDIKNDALPYCLASGYKVDLNRALVGLDS